MKEFNIGDVYLNRNNTGKSVFYIVLDKFYEGLKYLLMDTHEDGTLPITMHVYLTSSDGFRSLVSPYNYIGNAESDSSLFDEKLEYLLDAIYYLKGNYQRDNLQREKRLKLNDKIKVYTEDQKKKKPFKHNLDAIVKNAKQRSHRWDDSELNGLSLSFNKVQYILLKNKPENDGWIYSDDGKFCYDVDEIALKLSMKFKIGMNKLYLTYDSIKIAEVTSIDFKEGFVTINRPNIEFYDINEQKFKACFSMKGSEGGIRYFNNRKYRIYKIEDIDSMILEVEDPEEVSTDEKDKSREKVDISEVRKGLHVELNQGIRKKIDIDAANYRFRNNLHNIID